MALYTLHQFPEILNQYFLKPVRLKGSSIAYSETLRQEVIRHFLFTSFRSCGILHCSPLLLTWRVLKGYYLEDSTTTAGKWHPIFAPFIMRMAEPTMMPTLWRCTVHILMYVKCKFTWCRRFPDLQIYKTYVLTSTGSQETVHAQTLLFWCIC